MIGMKKLEDIMNELYIDLIFAIGLLEGVFITLGILCAFNRLKFRGAYWE